MGYNYAAYLLADRNGNSVQVAKYSGLDRIELIDSDEYGYCSLIKTCKQVLDRLDVENKTANKITHKERITHSYWNRVALREAVINAIIHNDYTNELVPKFEIFDDRLEITSAGHISEGKEQADFFAGYSNPRNKIIMRVFKDLKMVEYLGSGMPRILKAYPKESFEFSSNFIRMSLPISLAALELEKTTEKSSVITTEKKLQKKNYRKETTGKKAEELLQLCRVNPNITTSEMAESLELTIDGINFHLKALRVKNLLRRVGGKKNGHWEVLRSID